MSTLNLGELRCQRSAPSQCRSSGKAGSKDADRRRESVFYGIRVTTSGATPNGNDDDGAPTDHSRPGKPCVCGDGCASSTVGFACCSDDNTEHSLPAGRRRSGLSTLNHSLAQAHLVSPLQGLALRARRYRGRFQWRQPPTDRPKMIACP
jgi:hypothetical protein